MFPPADETGAAAGLEGNTTQSSTKGSLPLPNIYNTHTYILSTWNLQQTPTERGRIASLERDDKRRTEEPVGHRLLALTVCKGFCNLTLSVMQFVYVICCM